MHNDIPVVGYMDILGKPHFEKIARLLEHLQVEGTGLRIEICARFFFVATCAGRKLRSHWDPYFGLDLADTCRAVLRSMLSPLVTLLGSVLML